MSLDSYVTLGRSGLRVSPLCLGAMTFGEEWGWGTSPADAEAIIARYVEMGGNFIDGANAYTMGHSEVIIGDYLKKHPAQRDRLVIATKFSANMFPGDPNGGGSNRKAIIAQADESLRRLKLDYIDLYWLHNWDKHTPIEETLRALDDLVSAGKLRYVGASDTPAWKVAQAQTIAAFRGWSPFIALQIEYSLMERTVEGELMPAAAEFGLGVTPWSPLRGGALTGKFTRANASTAKSDRGDHVTSRLTEKDYDIIDALIAVAAELEVSPAAVAVAWVQAQSGVTSTIIGARTMEQLEQNVKSLDVTLAPEQLARLSELTTPKLNFPHDFLTNAKNIHHNGANVNGEQSALFREALPQPY
jgi:aryl-alcohol dehydrogenase-like predicted oxidoreductase